MPVKHISAVELSPNVMGVPVVLTNVCATSVAATASLVAWLVVRSQTNGSGQHT